MTAYPPQPATPPNQPTYQPAGAAPARRRGLKRIVTGIALMLLALPLGGGLMWWGISSGIGTLDDAQTVQSGGTVRFEAGQKMAVWAEESAGLDDDSRPSCSVTGGPGEVTVNHPAADVSLGNGETYERSMEVTAAEAGDYTVTCDRGGQVKITTADAATDAAKAISLGVAGGLLLGGLTFVTGLVLLVVGLVARSRSRKAPVPGTIG